METYHLRRKEKEISSQAEMDEILAGHKFMTIAMCKDDESYLVSLNYAYDQRTAETNKGTKPFGSFGALRRVGTRLPQ